MVRGLVWCTRCSKQLPVGAAFCRRCGWPTTHAVLVGRPVAVAPPAATPVTPPAAHATVEPTAATSVTELRRPALTPELEPADESPHTLADVLPAPLSWMARLDGPLVVMAVAAGLVLTIAFKPHGFFTVVLLAAVTATMIATFAAVATAIASWFNCGPRGRFAVGGTAIVLLFFAGVWLVAQPRTARTAAAANAATVTPAAAAGVTPAARAPALQNGMWRQVRSDDGETVYDFVLSRNRDFGDSTVLLQPLPEHEVRQLQVTGKLRPQSLELIITNPAGLSRTLRHVTVQVTCWEGPRTSYTQLFRIGRKILPGETVTLQAPGAAPSGPRQVLEFRIASAAVEAPRPKPPGGGSATLFVD